VGPRGFDDLLSLADVDRVVGSMALRLPSFRLVKDGATLPSSRYTKRARTGSEPVAGMADPVRIFAEFERGATIVLQGAHRFWPPLGEFCRALETELGHPVQVNAYITPPGSRGLAVHHDEHDVFVLQVHGTKRWQVYERSAGEREAPLLDVEVAPGDSLYIPKGFPHAATAQADASAHLTVGVLSPTWRQVLDEALAQVRDEPELDEALPLRFALDDPEELRRAVQERLGSFARLLEKADADAVAARLRRRFLVGRLPVLPGQLQQVLAIPRIVLETPVRRRPGSILRLQRNGERLSAFLGDRELRMPGWLEPVLAGIPDGAAFRVEELGPGLDREGRVVLARRLVREGLLEVVEPG
jgi:bifunctional lysine-specific demethylase and histidyl-hydroxylase NO66